MEVCSTHNCEKRNSDFKHYPCSILQEMYVYFFLCSRQKKKRSNVKIFYWSPLRLTRECSNSLTFGSCCFTCFPMVHDCFSCSLLIWGSPLFQATSFSVVNICPGPKLQVGLGWVGLFALFFCLVFVQTLTLSDTPHSKISTYNGLNCCLQEDLDTGKKRSQCV